MSLKKKTVNFLLIIFITAFAINCAEDTKKETNTETGLMGNLSENNITLSPNARKIDETPEEYQTKVAGELGVKKRTATNYLYDLNGKLIPEGAVSEEILFDEKGRKIEQRFFKSEKQIKFKWEFEYDNNNNLLSTSSYDDFGVLQVKRIYTYDENNNTKTKKEIYPTKGNEIIYNYKYDKDGNLIETAAETYEGKKSNEKKEYNSFGKVSKILMSAENGNKTAERIFTYDEDGKLISETLKFPGKPEQVTTYSKYVAIYPRVITAPMQKKEFEYNEDGNVTVDILYNADGGRQYKFINEYNDNGLLKKRTRYDALDKPALIVEYDYEFYK